MIIYLVDELFKDFGVMCVMVCKIDGNLGIYVNVLELGVVKSGDGVELVN